MRLAISALWLLLLYMPHINPREVSCEPALLLCRDYVDYIVLDLVVVANE